MRVAFYLPIVTPWWFDHIIAPMIRAMTRACEVHVLVPPMWRGTGIGPDHLRPFSEDGDILWHILDGPNHRRLRTSSAQDALLSLIHEIDPDLVLCRSAELGLGDLFPGEVRYIMEGGMPPLHTGQNWIVIQPDVLSYGRMPFLDEDRQAALLDLFAGNLERMRRRDAAGRDASWRAQAGVAPDRKVVVLPLEYEHKENIFTLHRHWPNNAEWIMDVARNLDPDIFLAITNHPLNTLYGDNRAVENVLGGLKGRAALIDASADGNGATALLARDCDGAILDMSKSWGHFVFRGRPIFRRSHLYSAPWLGLYEDMESFGRAVMRGEGRASPSDTALWFAFHAANNLIDPSSPALTAEDIVDHVVNPVNPTRWARNIEHYDAFNAESLTC